ncbi:MAG: FusB/FusC family EF-G-binding protein [Sarcina sp.]
MNTFIKKNKFNYINKCLFDLNNTFRNCTDPNIIEATKAYIQSKIWNKFENLNDEEKSILDITKITDPLHIDGYLKNLDQYVYGMENITSAQINKVFKKEKKLKLPDLSNQDSKLVYLGWIDPAIRKLLIIYNLDGKLFGMSCRLSTPTTSNANVCTLCNHVGDQNEVAFVSPICKTSSKNLDAYKSLGFHICLDSSECNKRITSTDKLEDLIKKVNNL